MHNAWLNSWFELEEDVRQMLADSQGFEDSTEFIGALCRQTVALHSAWLLRNEALPEQVHALHEAAIAREAV